MSDLERRALSIKNQPIEDKLRKAMRVLLVCAIGRPGSGRSHRTAGGGSSSTTQEETQQSSGSLLNGQHLENYKQMIKGMDDIDHDASDTSKSNRSKSGRGSDDEDDESSRSGSHAGNGSAGKGNDHNGARKSSVISMNLMKGLRESTPKNYQKGIDH